MKSTVFRRAIAALPLLALTQPIAAQDDPPAPPADTVQSTTGWGHPVYDIAPDPAVRFGVLENGMRYAILRNGTPQGTAVIRFGFDVGWIDEGEQELGLAPRLPEVLLQAAHRVRFEELHAC